MVIWWPHKDVSGQKPYETIMSCLFHDKDEIDVTIASSYLPITPEKRIVMN